MKVILYASLTASGSVAIPSENHPIPREVLADFLALARQVGNVINGRHTYEALLKRNAKEALKNLKFVVVSTSLNDKPEFGVKVTSPKAALSYLDQAGAEVALVGRGAGVDRSFLEQGLVDELIINIEPLLTAVTSLLTSARFVHTNLQLLDTKALNAQIVQLHYRLQKPV